MRSEEIQAEIDNIRKEMLNYEVWETEYYNRILKIKQLESLISKKEGGYEK